jgi:G3E family GTPase
MSLYENSICVCCTFRRNTARVNGEIDSNIITEVIVEYSGIRVPMFRITVVSEMLEKAYHYMLCLNVFFIMLEVFGFDFK